MEDLVGVLTKFHREIVVPDIERIVDAAERRLRDEMHSGFDAITQRLDKLETEYHMLVVGLKRVEERLDRVEERLDKVEQRLDKLALRSELLELKNKVDVLQGQVRAIEARLDS